MDESLVFGILSFLVFAVPLVGALWRVFSVREQLQVAIAHNAHRLDLLEQRLEHLLDQQVLTFNGQKEVLQHVRDRSLRSEEKLGERLADLEGFLEKTTTFNRRQTG